MTDQQRIDLSKELNLKLSAGSEPHINRKFQPPPVNHCDTSPSLIKFRPKPTPAAATNQFLGGVLSSSSPGRPTQNDSDISSHLNLESGQSLPSKPSRFNGIQPLTPNSMNGTLHRPPRGAHEIPNFNGKSTPVRSTSPPSTTNTVTVRPLSPENRPLPSPHHPQVHPQLVSRPLSPTFQVPQGQRPLPRPPPKESASHQSLSTSSPNNLSPPPVGRKPLPTPEENLTIEKICSYREQKQFEYLWNSFFTRALGNVAVEVEENVDETGNDVFHVKVRNKRSDEVVICFSRGLKLDKFKVTKNLTLISISQIAAICEGGVIPGSVYEVY